MSRTALVGVVLAIAVALLLVWNDSVGDDDSSSPSSRFLSRRRRRRLDGASNDGATFLGVPVTYRSNPLPYSRTHCIGEAFGRVDPLYAWLYRSCEFRHICYDTNRQDFVLFPSPQEQKLAKLATQQEGVTLSSTSLTRPPVSLAAVDPPDGSNDDKQQQEVVMSELFSNLSWFPIVDDMSNERPVGYYQLPDTHILVPFLESRPMSNDSVRNKDWLSIFALLYVFGLEDKSLILLRHATTAGAVIQNNCGSECQALLQTHLPALGIRQPQTIMADDKALSSSSPSSLPQSYLVCAKYGATGLGMLMTGSEPVWRDNKWTNTHTIGRDATLRAFQEYEERNTVQSS